jgi:hypothetical protein
MNAAALLERLENVQRAAHGWRANCPNGHAKARGSLSVTEAEDGRVLLHCFACGDTPGILAAVGVEAADLFPERIRDPSPEGRRQAREAFRRNSWAVAVRVLAREATVVLIAADMLRHGGGLAAEDDGRLMLAMQRIEDARAVLA